MVLNIEKYLENKTKTILNRLVNIDQDYPKASLDHDRLSTPRKIINLIYTEPQKKRRNFNNSIRYGKQSIYFL